MSKPSFYRQHPAVAIERQRESFIKSVTKATLFAAMVTVGVVLLAAYFDVLVP